MLPGPPFAVTGPFNRTYVLMRSPWAIPNEPQIFKKRSLSGVVYLNFKFGNKLIHRGNMSLGYARFRLKPISFTVLVAFEGIITALLFLFDIKKFDQFITLGSYKSQVFILGGYLLFCMTLLAVSLMLRKPPRLETKISNFFNQYFLFLFSGCAILFSVSLFFIIQPPPLLTWFSIGAYKRQFFLPILVWLTLVSLQILVLGWFQKKTLVKQWSSWVVNKFHWIGNSSVIGYIFLGLAFFISLGSMLFSNYNFADESDTIAVGWMVSRGLILYKDIFSHHFPISYFWAAAVIKLFGPSFTILRFSLVVLRTIVFFFSMRLSRFTFSLGLTALVWSLVDYLYLGNTLIYYSFSGIFAVGILAVSLAILTKKTEARSNLLVTIGLLSGLMVLCDPEKIVLAAITATFVVAGGIVGCESFGERLRKAMIRAVWLIAGAAIPLVLFFVYLVSTNSIQDFFKNAILFNTQVYSKYAGNITLGDFIEPITNGLYLFTGQIGKVVDPNILLTDPNQIDGWLYSLFLFRMIIVLGLFLLIFNRQWLSAGFLYIFGAIMIVRGLRFFYSSPANLTSIFIGVLFIFELPERPGESNPILAPTRVVQWIKGIQFIIPMTIRLVVLFMLLWLGIRGLDTYVSLLSQSRQDFQLSPYERNIGFYQTATCGNPTVKVLIYPLDPYYYFAAQLLPASKYSFMTPWVAEVGQDQAIADIQGKPVLVWFDRDASIWGKAVKIYLAKFVNYVDNFLIPLDKKNFYASPELKALCP
jgi:hypothetical protein